MNALDINNESTCWNSDGQADGEFDNFFVISFHRRVCVEEIRIQFQGGFVAEECTLFFSSTTETNSSSWKEMEDAEIEPENINSIQKFSISSDIEENERCCNALKISFQSGTDFYGRVIIYKFEVWGRENETIE